MAFDIGADDPETGVWTYAYYRARPGGALYESAWYIAPSGSNLGGYYYYDGYSNRFYYGEGGVALVGLQSVGSKQYYFDYSGMAIRSIHFIDGNSVYYAGADCDVSLVTIDGLYRELWNGGTACVSSGKLLKNAWKHIGSYWYYFDNLGKSYTAGSYLINGKHYYFRSDGVMASDGWVTGTPSAYPSMYADHTGALLTGEQKIDGRWYYFSPEGNLQKGAVLYDGKLYLCAPDGSYVRTMKNGWMDWSGTRYYVEEGSVLRNGVYNIDGTYYYFDYDGRLGRNTSWNSMLFGSDGARLGGGWHTIGNAKYYVDADTSSYVHSTEREIDGKTYYFDGSGRVVTGTLKRGDFVYEYGSDGAFISKKAIDNGWTLVDGSYYYYRDGKPVTNTWVGKYYLGYGGVMARNQVVGEYYVGNDGGYLRGQLIERGQSRLYAKANGKLAKNEWLEIDGATYYFDGVWAVTGVRLIHGQICLFGNDAKLVSKRSVGSIDGWMDFGSGNFAYVLNGSPVITGEITVDGAKYHFSNGLRTHDTVMNARWFDSSGKAVGYTGWQTVGGTKRFFLENGRVASGWIVDSGKTYYLNAGIPVDGYMVIGSRLYQFENGVLQQDCSINNGWLKKGDDWFYFEDGAAVTSGLRLIGGKLYGFAGGKMATNTIVYGGSNLMEYGTYFVGANGTVAANAGFKTINGRTYYIGADGKALSGIRNIGGKIYYL